MKPIEPGAICIIKPGCKHFLCNPEIRFLGKPVTVLRMANAGPASCGCVRWRVSGDFGVPIPIASECVLLRIDDDDPDAVTEPGQHEVEA